MPEERTRSRRLIAVAFPAMVGTRVLGAALSPILFAHAPIVLILMSPFLINLVIVGPLVGPAIYFPVALTITTLQCVVGFLFGSTYGPRAMEWLVSRTPVSQARAELFLDLVRRASVFALFAVPGPILGTIAGVAGIPRRTFFIAVVPAQAIWVAAAYFAGEQLLVWIELARTFVTEHAFAATGLTVSLVGLRWLLSRGGSTDDQPT